MRKKDRGLSSAVLTGFQYASYDNIVVMDADLSHDENLLPKIAQQMYMGTADFVLASRYMKGGGVCLYVK